MTTSDLYNLSRFLDAQKDVYEQAVKELRKGEKKSHWMWFIFPQLQGLGSSSTAKYYAIKDENEARAYRDHPVLGPRLADACEVLFNIHNKSAAEIFGFPDDMKLRSCMTLFAIVTPGITVYSRVLDDYFNGERDSRTVELLKT